MLHVNKVPPYLSPPKPGGETGSFPYFRGRLGWGSYGMDKLFDIEIPAASVVMTGTYPSG